MQEPCAFYKIKVTTLQSKTISPDQAPLFPQFSRKEYCAHPKSTYLRDTIGPSVPCGGDLEKCIISSEDRRAA